MAGHYPLQINVPLRERRTYLHSTNLFDFLVAHTGADRNLSLSFRRKIECKVEVLPTAACGRVEDYPARFVGGTPDGAVDLVLRETEPLTPLARREPYNEDAVAQGSRIEGAAIYSENSNGGSSIERIVALNKKLLTQVSEGQKTLLFSRVSLKSIPSKSARMRIDLKSRLGMTLFRSAIFSDEESVGEIIFYGT